MHIITIIIGHTHVTPTSCNIFAFLLFQVGAVDIDSGWSTGFNNFVFDAKKYPTPSEMVSFIFKVAPIYLLIRKNLFLFRLSTYPSLS